MNNWFHNTAIQFQMWDLTHLLTIGLIGFFLITIYVYRNSLLKYRDIIRITVGITLILSRITLDIWYITTNNWSVSSSLPLELCSIASLLAGIMLLSKSRFLVEVIYFIGIGGALQAIITPELYFGFPQFRYIQFFTDHTLLIFAPLLMIWLFNFKITFKSLIKAFITINVIAAIVFVINYVLDANYMFLSAKPSSASLLDLLGAYPFYLLSLEFIVIAVFLILYVPFAIFKSYRKNDKR